MTSPEIRNIYPGYAAQPQTTNMILRSLGANAGVGGGDIPATALGFIPDPNKPALYVEKGQLGLRMSDYVVGDGITDDTDNVQRWIDKSELTGQELIADRGECRIAGPIYLPLALTIRGFGRTNGRVFTQDKTIRNVAFHTYVNGSVFRPKYSSPQVTTLSIEGVEFRQRLSPFFTYGPTSVLFDAGITVSNSDISRCTVDQFGTVFAGRIQGCSNITRNFFMTIWNALTSGDVYDSKLNYNYISGSVNVNSTGITLTSNVTFSQFVNNFIEFMKYGVRVVSSSAVGNIIAHNQFDYCYRGIGTDASRTLSGSIISNNVFHACRASQALPYFINPDTDMTTTPWIGIESSQGITDTSIAHNLFYDCDTGWKVRNYPVWNFETRGNIYKNVATKTDYLVQNSLQAGEQTGIFIQELDRAKGALPSAAVTGSSIVSFDRQFFINSSTGKLVYNDNGTWRHADGTTAP